MKKDENIASIFSNNSLEWNIIDMAVAGIGAVHVPVYPTISDSDYVFILNQAEVRIIFVSDQTIYNKISGLIRELPHLLLTLPMTEVLLRVGSIRPVAGKPPSCRVGVVGGRTAR